jgi:hypothetical protein
MYIWCRGSSRLSGQSSYTHTHRPRCTHTHIDVYTHTHVCIPRELEEMSRLFKVELTRNMAANTRTASPYTIHRIHEYMNTWICEHVNIWICEYVNRPHSMYIIVFTRNMAANTRAASPYTIHQHPHRLALHNTPRTFELISRWLTIWAQSP